MKKGRWKQVKNNPRYWVSEEGEIWSTLINRKLKPCERNSRPNNKGYLSVGLSQGDGRRRMTLIHRLVADAYLPKVAGKTYVDHISGDVKDNHYKNLRWCTLSENQRNRKDQVLNETLVSYIKCIRLLTKWGAVKIARLLKLHNGRANVSVVLTKCAWIDVEPCHPNELPDYIREQLKDYL